MAMRTIRQSGGAEEIPILDDADTRVLGAGEERELLRDLAACKQKLAKALAQLDGVDLPRGADDPQALAHFIASGRANDGVAQARLGAVFHRYSELRGKLALANMRLVAHVAKRFRDRGVAYSDLIQEGFCGLLEAIDRFDLTHETKLATYATWWIRQAMQRSVASGAYPVRLSPRHLRQLAQSQEEAERAAGAKGKRPGSESLGGSPEMIRRIQAATRPTVSLDATLETTSNFNLLQVMSDPEANRTGEVDMDETVGRLMEELRPREQQVLSLRFGLSGEPRLSLSQVGKVLAVSKERVRQIQDRALEKLRAIVKDNPLPDALMSGA
jgi:RNA polymerase primary sigma factor